MKKILSVVLAMIIGALSVPFTAFAAENGFKVYESVIVVSADASATMRLMMRFFQKQLPEDVLESLALTIGADVPARIPTPQL